MLKQWIAHCAQLCKREPDGVLSGYQKVFTNLDIDFKLYADFDYSDVHYTSAKVKALFRNYYVEDSFQTALDLWRKQSPKGKFSSVGFHCYNHLVKAHAGTSPLASTIGPCLQAVTLTAESKGKARVDVTFRSTELFRKFPADLIFLSGLLQQFDLAPGTPMRVHAANAHLRPMYWLLIAHHHPDPLAWMQDMRRGDPTWWAEVIKWNLFHLDDEVAKNYKQSARIGKRARSRLDATTLRRLEEYCRTHSRTV